MQRFGRHRFESFVDLMELCAIGHEVENNPDAARVSTAKRKLPSLRLAHDAARAAGDFGDHIRSKTLDDLVERALHRREGRQMLDQLVAARHSSRH